MCECVFLWVFLFFIYSRKTLMFVRCMMCSVLSCMYNHISHRNVERHEYVAHIKYTQAFSTMSRRKLAIFVIVYDIVDFFFGSHSPYRIPYSMNERRAVHAYTAYYRNIYIYRERERYLLLRILVEYYIIHVVTVWLALVCASRFCWCCCCCFCCLCCCYRRSLHHSLAVIVFGAGNGRRM